MTDKNVSAPVQDPVGWFTSSYTNASGSCVEVRFTGDAVLVRDSKDRRVGRPVIGVSAGGWASFVKTLRRPSS